MSFSGINLFKLGGHPVNLLFRFLLELTVLGVVAIWSWKSIESWAGMVLAFVIPFVMAVIWGTFAVPDDPSRSGKAPVPTPGALRLLLELLFFWTNFAKDLWRFQLQGLMSEFAW